MIRSFVVLTSLVFSQIVSGMMVQHLETPKKPNFSSRKNTPVSESLQGSHQKNYSSTHDKNDVNESARRNLFDSDFRVEPLHERMRELEQFHRMDSRNGYAADQFQQTGQIPDEWADSSKDESNRKFSRFETRREYKKNRPRRNDTESSGETFAAPRTRENNGERRICENFSSPAGRGSYSGQGQIKPSVISGAPEDNECCICMVDFDGSKKAPMKLPCGHRVCKECLNYSGDGEITECPLCRKQIGNKQEVTPDHAFMIHQASDHNRTSATSTRLQPDREQEEIEMAAQQVAERKARIEQRPLFGTHHVLGTSGETKECPICLTTASEGETKVRFGCGHEVCGDCFNGHMKHSGLNTRCPECQQRLIAPRGLHGIEVVYVPDEGSSGYSYIHNNREYIIHAGDQGVVRGFRYMSGQGFLLNVEFHRTVDMPLQGTWLVPAGNLAGHNLGRNESVLAGMLVRYNGHLYRIHNPDVGGTDIHLVPATEHSPAIEGTVRPQDLVAEPLPAGFAIDQALTYVGAPRSIDFDLPGGRTTAFIQPGAEAVLLSMDEPDYVLVWFNVEVVDDSIDHNESNPYNGRRIPMIHQERLHITEVTSLSHAQWVARMVYDHASLNNQGSVRADPDSLLLINFDDITFNNLSEGAVASLRATYEWMKSQDNEAQVEINAFVNRFVDAYKALWEYQ